MFNTTVIAPGKHTTEYVTKEVHEHRAPTDDSVRLLREMEAKAHEQIVRSVHVGDATFDCVVHMQQNMVDQSTELLAIFSLNGKKMTAKHRVHTYDYSAPKDIEALRNAIAKEIATEVLVPAWEKMRL